VLAILAFKMNVIVGLVLIVHMQDIVPMSLVNVSVAWNGFISPIEFQMGNLPESMTALIWRIFMFASMPASTHLSWFMHLNASAI
jgi:hypothetical protein